MIRTLTLFSTALLGMLAAPASAASLIVSQDYDSALFVAAGVTAVGDSNGGLEAASAGAWNASGWSGNYYANRSVGPIQPGFISLSGLAPNSAVTFTGILGFLESWDSQDGGCCNPDYLDFFINGVQVASMTTNNALGTIEDYDGATRIFYQQQVNGNGYYSDTLADLSTAAFLNSFADANGNFNLTVQASGGGWQGGTDEGWGLDDIRIYGTVANTGAVPEPSTWAMMIAGFGAIGAVARRRRTRVSFV